MWNHQGRTAWGVSMLGLASVAGCNTEQFPRPVLGTVGEISSEDPNEKSNRQSIAPPAAGPYRKPILSSGDAKVPPSTGANQTAIDVELGIRVEQIRREAYEQGRKFGMAEAAVTHFERGLAMGKEQGRNAGKDEAAEANRLAIKLAVKEAVESAEVITRLQTAEDIRQAARLREMADTNLPAYFLGTVLVCVLALMAARSGRRRDQTVSEQARDYRVFIQDVFEVAAKLIQHREGDGSVCKVLPPPIVKDTDPFRFGGGK